MNPLRPPPTPVHTDNTSTKKSEPPCWDAVSPQSLPNQSRACWFGATQGKCFTRGNGLLRRPQVLLHFIPVPPSDLWSVKTGLC